MAPELFANVRHCRPSTEAKGETMIDKHPLCKHCSEPLPEYKSGLYLGTFCPIDRWSAVQLSPEEADCAIQALSDPAMQCEAEYGADGRRIRLRCLAEGPADCAGGAERLVVMKRIPGGEGDVSSLRPEVDGEWIELSPEQLRSFEEEGILVLRTASPPGSGTEIRDSGRLPLEK